MGRDYRPIDADSVHRTRGENKTPLNGVKILKYMCHVMNLHGRRSDANRIGLLLF